MSCYNERAVKKLLADVRRLSRTGNGPCGGGGMLGEFHSGVRHAESRFRKKCREVLKTFEENNAKDDGQSPVDPMVENSQIPPSTCDKTL